MPPTPSSFPYNPTPWGKTSRTAHLDRLVAIASEVLSGKPNDESTPETNCDAEEEVPVFDNPFRFSCENACEFTR